MRLGLSRSVVLATGLLLLFAAGVEAGDVIRFKNGRSLTGEIVAEDGESVTIEIEGGGRLTVPRRDIEEILRDATLASGEDAVGAGVLRAEHFFVWAGTKRVGTRSLWVRKGDADGLVIEEESAFLNEKGKEDVRVRVVETVTSTLEPVSIVYREISVGGQTLMEGTVRDGKLALTVHSPGSKREATLALPPGVRFPLAAREFAIRERERLKGVWEAKVFDPREENFFRYRFRAAGERRMDWEGAVVPATVITRQRGSREPEEIWIDAADRTLTEELNGPALVAVRTTRERLEAVRSGAEVTPSEEELRVRPEYVDRERGFVVRKPTLSWTFEPGKAGERTVLTISNLRWFAGVDVIVLDEVPEGGLVSSLAVEMEKRFASASRDFEKLSEGYLEVGGEKACRILASSRNKGEEIRSLLVGVLHGGQTWLVAMAAPKAYWKGAQPEFEAILASFRFLD